MKGNCTVSHLAHLLSFPEFAGNRPQNRLDPLSDDRVVYWMEYCKSHVKGGASPYRFPEYVFDMHTGNFELSKSSWFLREDECLTPRPTDVTFLEWENKALQGAHSRCKKWEQNGWVEKKKKGGKKRSSEEKKPEKKKSKQEKDE